MALTVKFYGTRGQIMSVSRDRFLYGGHTSCLTITQGKDVVIVDAGFGIAKLASELTQDQDLSKGGYECHILLTHFHWDHIQGLQYFSPIYFKGNRIHVHTPFEVDVVREVLNLLLDGSYTPFDGLDSLPCEWLFHQLNEKNTVGPYSVSYHPTAHVGQAYAYSIESDVSRVVVSGDHDATPSDTNDSFVNWAQGCDILIHEAMFTPREYSLAANMGHSSFMSAIENATRIEADLTLLNHHAPLRSDADLAEHERYLEKLYNNDKRRLHFAREGLPYFVSKKR